MTFKKNSDFVLNGYNLLTLYQVIVKTILNIQILLTETVITEDHHLVKPNSLFNIEKLKSTELFYCIINSSCNTKPTSQIYFEKKFDSKELDSGLIYTLPRKVTGNTYLRSLQYKILNNILYLNEKLQQYHLAPFTILLVKILHIFSVIVHVFNLMLTS